MYVKALTSIQHSKHTKAKDNQLG